MQRFFHCKAETKMIINTSKYSKRYAYIFSASFFILKFKTFKINKKDSEFMLGSY